MVAGTKPTIGVVIPAYNNSEFINECVDSVINQTYPPTQIVLCDDVSSDGTRDIVRSYEQNYPELVEAVYHTQNSGIAANLNSGIRRITQDYMSLVAADDTWRPDKLRLEIERLQAEPGARWVYSQSVMTDAEGNFIEVFKETYTGQEGRILFPSLANDMALRNFLAETSLVREVGYYDETPRTGTIRSDSRWRRRSHGFRLLQ